MGFFSFLAVWFVLVSFSSATVQTVAMNQVTNGYCNAASDLDICTSTPCSTIVDCAAGIFGANTVTALHVGSGAAARNRTSGTLSTYIGNLLGLRTISLDVSKYYGTLPTELGLLVNLNTFSMSANALSGTIPTELGNCPITQFVLANNNLTGSIPTHFGNWAGGLQLFVVNNNLLEGTLPTQTGLWTNAYGLAFSSNSISGTLPTQSGLWRNMTYLDFSHNAFGGTLPSELGQITRLSNLYLNFNLFSGTIPTHLGSLSRLTTFVLNDNLLTGTLPTEVGRLQSCKQLDVSNNGLSGELPTHLGTMTNLVAFDISRNNFSGTIPTQIGYCTYLNTLHMSQNKLTNMPTELGKLSLLVDLNLFSNQITGTIPTELATCYLMVNFRVAINSLSGTIPNFGPTWPFCGYVEIAQNRLTGGEFNGYPNLLALRGNSNLFTTLKVNITSKVLQLIDFNNNLLTDFPSFLFEYPGVTRVPVVTLSSNQIGRATFRQMNYQILFLDLSYNQIVLDSDEILFLTPVAGCICPDDTSLLTDPLVHNYILTVNRIDFKVMNLIELMGYPDGRNFSCGCLRAPPANKTSQLSISPQDSNECTQGTHACEQICADGWLPVLSYTCDCNIGYTLDANRLNCTPICGDGLLQPEEECDYVRSPYGCAPNCTQMAGYTCGSAGCSAICGDGVLSPPEECDDANAATPGCNATCYLEAGYACPVPNASCQQCYSPWLPLEINENLLLYPRFRGLGYTLNGLPFTSCNLCGGGASIQYRTLLPYPSCGGLTTILQDYCSFACSNLEVFSSAKESLYTVQFYFNSSDFLNQILNHFFSLSATMTPSQKRSVNTLNFQLSPCVNNQTANASINTIMAAIAALATDIVPNIPALQTTGAGCSIDLVSSDPTSLAGSDTTGIVIGVICAFAALVVLILAAVLAYYYFRSDLHQLPEEIRWSYLHKVTHPWSWSYNGSTATGYFERKYPTGSDEWVRVESLLTRNLHCDLPVAEIYAVYNPSLTSSFINHWQVTISRKRHSPEHFFHDTYSKNANKMAVIESYNEMVQGFTWNTNNSRTEAVPIISALHGTDYHIAEKIAQTGFAALSSLDAGFFGKGIYFSSYFCYCLPYCFSKRKPALLLSYLNLGHVFPVTEDHKDKEKSLMGAALKGGYSAHYVRTNTDGHCINPSVDNIRQSYDEIVLGQESQILPAFIIVLDPSNAQEAMRKWDRKLPSEKCAPVQATMSEYEADSSMLVDLHSPSTSSAKRVKSNVYSQQSFECV